MSTYNAKNYTEQGGDKTHVGGTFEVESGGSLSVKSGATGAVKSGGALDIEAGGALKIAGAAINTSAEELNQLDLSAVGARLMLAKSVITRAADTNAHDSTIILPAKAIVLDAFIDVTTQEATGETKTIDVGIKTGAGDALLNNVSCATAGIKRGTLVSTGQTVGTGMSVDESGAGILVPEFNAGYGGKTVNYTFGSNDWAEFVGNLFVLYIEIA
jgi:hypothetical protein